MRRSQIQMALVRFVLLQALFHIAVLADLQGVATGDVINGAAAAGAVTNGATVAGAMPTVIPATGPVPIGAAEKCPEGLSRRCLDDGCYCVRPSRPVYRPKPRPRPTPTPSSLMTEDAAAVGATTNGTAPTGELTNGATVASAMPTVIPATGPVPIDAMEKCPEGLIRRCFSDGCKCGKPPRPVIRPRPRPSLKQTSTMATGAAAIGDAAAGTVSKDPAVAGAANKVATSAGAMTNGTAVIGAVTPRPYGEDANGKCLKGLRRRCLDDGCFCVNYRDSRPRSAPRK